MPRLFLMLAVIAVFAGCAGDVYEGKDHPYRVLMRDMKPHYQTLEKFSKDANLKDDALKACMALVELGEKGHDMAPGFLKPEQVTAHQKLFMDISMAAKSHAGYIKAGQIKQGQEMYSVLSSIKKEGHTTYKDQAKAHRGEDPKK